jgi:hypothetical protein
VVLSPPANEEIEAMGREFESRQSFKNVNRPLFAVDKHQLSGRFAANVQLLDKTGWQ